MCVRACTDGASLGISDTECCCPTRSSDGIAAAQFQPTDARLAITINPSQARMMNSENLRIVRAMKGGRGRSVLMRPSLVPQQQGPYQRTGSHRPKNALAGRGRTRSGHQNQRPSSAAIEGVMNARTINVSNNRPMPMVVPT